MPEFDLPAEQLDALAALLHSLNAPAAESVALGDSAAGKRFFLGEGKCASCHMVSGGGKAIGPDLSDVGARMTVEDIREALLKPDAHTAPGYALVTVKLRDGRTIRGFAKNRSNFDIGVQDLEGQFHSLQEEQISSIEDEKKSLMEPVKAGPDQLQNLIAYLGRLTGVTPGMPATAGPSDAQGIEFSRLVDPKPGDWLTYNGKLGGNRYSEMTQIDTSNVNKLGVKWTFAIPLWVQLLLRHTGLNTPQGFDPFIPEQYRILIDGISRFRTNREFDLNPDNGDALRLLGVRYFISSENGPLYSQLSSSPHFRLLQPADSYYKVFEYVNSRPSFAWEEMDHEVELRTWQPERRAFIVRSPSGGLFRLAEQFFPGWNATVDEIPVSIERCHKAFQCIAVPPGQHRLEFRYHSRWLILGGMVSFCSILLLAKCIRESALDGLSQATLRGSILLNSFANSFWARRTS